MKNLNTVLTGAVILLLGGCEFQSYKEYRTPSYDGAFTWTRVTKSAPWSNRLDHTSVSYNNRIWVMGGYNPGAIKGDTYLEDVWSSPDGVDWKQETGSAPWLGRRGHASVVFDDGSGEAIYVIGGFTVDEATGYREYTNDVWRSTSGAEWTQVKERTYPPLDSIYDWIPRFNHTCVVANHGGTDYIYLIGGATMLEDSLSRARYAMKYFSDVWRTSDGIQWELLPATDFGIRSEHAVTVDQSTGRIFLQGGRSGVIFEGEDQLSKPNSDWHWLWSSDDGINWTAEHDTTEVELAFLHRSDHKLVHINESLFGLPGKSANNVHLLFSDPPNYGFWRRDPGSLWSVDSEGSDFGARYAYSLVEHDGKIWIMGGETNFHGPDNDIWYGEIR
jgi:hypothetical protein